MIALSPELRRQIESHGTEAYPDECCGALLGRPRDGGARIERVERLPNSRGDERRRRYRIDAREYRRVETLAEAEGLELLGFYHSHPDHPATPSEFDREHALPSFHYLVLSVDSKGSGELGSWILSEDRGAFAQEELTAGAKEGS
jgi:proteasome lid subunit RPN8/RPN11